MIVRIVKDGAEIRNPRNLMGEILKVYFVSDTIPVDIDDDKIRGMYCRSCPNRFTCETSSLDCDNTNKFLREVNEYLQEINK